jgi:Ca-activated chloride channel family protein
MKKLLQFLLCLGIFPCIIWGQSPASSIEKGNADYALRKYNEARQHYEAALRNDVNKLYPQAYFNLGNTYFQLVNFSEAEKEYQSFIASTSDKTLQSAAYYNIGNCYLSQKNYVESVAAFRKALQLNPKNEDARYNLSYALAILANENGGTSANKSSQPSTKEKKTPPLPPLSQKEQQQLLKTLSQSESQAMNNQAKEKKPGQNAPAKDW